MSTQFYLNPPSPFPQVEGNQGQDHLLFTFSSPSSICFKATHELGDYDEDYQEPPPRLHKHEAGVRFSAGGSVDQNQIASSLPAVADQNYNNRYRKPSPICKRDDLLSNPCDNGPINSPTKWMSSKMRIMKKMMNSDRTVSNKLNKDAQTSPNDHNNSTIRVCSDCNTTKTPLWRSGPKGPKSLCNACGIRQRKARRALAAASAAASGGVVPADTLTNNEAVPKEKRSESNCIIQYKKQCKPAGPRTKKKLQFDNFIVSLSENSSFHSMFPQDERDAAILLMAISCGMVYS